MAILAGLALRLWDVGRESFWLDEAGRAAIASLPLADVPHSVAVVELSPPLYHLLLHFWMRFVGSGDVAVRLLSALLFVPSVPLAWSLGSAAIGRSGAAAMAGLVAANPFAVHYGQEAAMYALVLPLSLGALRAAIGVIEGPPHQRPPWLAAYVVLGGLALYTHYYAGFLLAAVGLVGVAHSAVHRARHGVIAWCGAHAVIALAFVPWLGVAIEQAGLAASVADWSGVSPIEALPRYAGAVFAGAADPWAAPLGMALLGAAGVGAWRLRRRPAGPALAWLLLAVLILPLVLGTVSSGFLHSFRERGFVAVAAAPWLLAVGAVIGDAPRRWWETAARAGVGVALLAATVGGLASHHGERKEQWWDAAAIVAAGAGPDDPIFFVHFGGQLAFDRYFTGTARRIGLPASFAWTDGYRAPYVVTSDDVRAKATPALDGSRRAWLVLSHHQGRGGEHVTEYLDRWGTRAADVGLYGVRVLRYER